MAKGIEKLLKAALSKFSNEEFVPPEALMDRPNTTIYPSLLQDAEPLAGGMGGQLGQLALGMTDEFMGGMMGGAEQGGGGMESMMAQMMGGGAPGMGGPEMMGGVDAAQMMMNPGAPQGPQPGPLPDEGMPIPGDG